MEKLLKDILSRALNNRDYRKERIFSYTEEVSPDLGIYAIVAKNRNPSNTKSGPMDVSFYINLSPVMEDILITDYTIRHREDIGKIASEARSRIMNYAKYRFLSNIVDNNTFQAARFLKGVYDMGYNQFTIPLPLDGNDYSLVFSISDFGDTQIINVDSEDLIPLVGDSFEEISSKFHDLYLHVEDYWKKEASNEEDEFEIEL